VSILYSNSSRTSAARAILPFFKLFRAGQVFEVMVWSGGHPGLTSGEHDEYVEKAVAVLGGGGQLVADGAELAGAVMVRRQPDTFCCSLASRMSRSVPLSSGGGMAGPG
jgi:hypothetical protein